MQHSWFLRHLLRSRRPGHRPRLLLGLLLLLLVGSTASCLGPLRPVELRHLAPVEVATADVVGGLRADPGVPVRLAPVRSAGHLGERVVWQGPDGARGFEEWLRWTERPAAHLERALTRAIAAHASLAPSATAGSARLEVELLQFDLVRDGRGTAAGARLAFEARLVEPEGTVRVLGLRAGEHVFDSGTDPATGLALALGQLLASLAAALAEDLAEILSASPTETAGA